MDRYDPAATDRITLEGMTFTGRHGVLPDEQVEAQPFVVSVEFPVDARSAARDDTLASTVDYGVVFDAVREVVEQRSYRLIETLAEAVAAAVLERTAVTSVRVRLRKPKAPLPGAFDHVEIEIRRTADESRAAARQGELPQR